MGYEAKNKVVLITGASSGIGAEVVRLFVEENARHVAVIDIAEVEGIALQNELNSKHGPNKVKFYKGDVTNDDQLFGIFNAVTEEQGYIDVLVNNAGIMNDSLHTYKKEIDINVTATVTGTLKALELMRKDHGGRGGTVINISSVAGLTQFHDMPIYWATKSAVIQFSTCIGLEEYYQKTGVRLLTICFGNTATSLVSTAKLGSFDKGVEVGTLMSKLNEFPKQSILSAAKGLLEAYKLGKSSSTWLVNNDLPAVDITDDVKDGYALMARRIFS